MAVPTRAFSTKKRLAFERNDLNPATIRDVIRGPTPRPRIVWQVPLANPPSQPSSRFREGVRSQRDYEIVMTPQEREVTLRSLLLGAATRALDISKSGAINRCRSERICCYGLFRARGSDRENGFISCRPLYPSHGASTAAIARPFSNRPQPNTRVQPLCCTANGNSA